MYVVNKAGVSIMTYLLVFSVFSFGASNMLQAASTAALPQMEGLTLVSSEVKNQVITHDIKYFDTEAFLLVPETGKLVGGIVYFHQLGLSRNRSQFIAEAREMALQGYACLLINGKTPWQTGWNGTPTDKANISTQLDELKRSFDVLKNLEGMSAKPLHFVGHDYGGMYGAMLAAKVDFVKTYAILAPVANFGDWLSYSVPGANKASYDTMLGDLQPALALASLKNRSHILLQYASSDQYVSEQQRNALVNACPGASVQIIKGASHSDIFIKGKQERLAWFAQQAKL